MRITLHDKLSRVSALRPAVRRAQPVSGELPAGAEDLAQLLGGECLRNHYGEFLRVRQWHAEPQAFPAPNGALELLLRDAPRIAADPEKWLFLDTETTGLAGGTGTYAFLVGLAWWDAGGLQVEQLFLRDYTEEHSLLLELSERMRERPVLVTFNGKAFDWPLLETRYRMTRSIEPPEPAAHLDLLHPARQLWRLRLGSVRLTELEHHVLAPPALPWDRRHDVRSDMIPQIYFDYLRGGSAVPLLDVFRHNQMDLRGLAALAGRIFALLDDPEEAAGDALELYGLSRLLSRRGPEASGRARQVYERALAAGLPEAVDRVARRELATLAKREGDFPRATALWQELIGSVGAGLAPPSGRPRPAPTTADGTVVSLDAIDAYEQLAIYYEHHAKQPERAAELTRAALDQLRHSLRLGLVDAARYTRLRARLDRRLARLGGKARHRLFEAPGPAARRSEL